MSERPFVHLHCHSHYSLLDGASRIPELVERVKGLGMNAVALTDHGNLYGAIELYREAKSAGVKPIIGYEAYVAPGKRTERDAKGMSEAAYHLTLLARNKQGFRNLIQMASIAFLEGFYYRPRIDKELLEAHRDGLICLSGCASSEFSTLILKNQMDEATELARWYARVFGENFYVEIQSNGLEVQRLCAEGAIDIARRLGLPLVATCDAHYLCQADAGAHDVLLCINTGKQRSDENRLKYGSDQFFVRGPEDVYAQFPDQEEAVHRSQQIADRCELELDFKTRHFPVFDPPKGKTAEDYLRELCEQGLKERYGDSGGTGWPPTSAPDKPPTRGGQPVAPEERLKLELDVINGLGFAGYFLIVWEFVRFARERGIPCSARGSACGSLVSYVLHLSHVDPLEYDLLFERFLDPNRTEAPDIDIDFCQERREEVLQYVREKYGEGSVAQIATFGTLAARAAVRDVGRVLGIELPRVDQIAKMIPQQLGITLDGAIRQNPDLRKEYENDPRIHELIDIARKLEGTNRNVGTHAAGVVIANGLLTDHVPVQRVWPKGDAGTRGHADTETSGGDESDAIAAAVAQSRPRVSAAPVREAPITTQWTMDDLDKVGLLKMDFLGLRNLTLLDKAVRLIKQTRGVDVDLFQLPKDDRETFALLQKGDTQGVFQFESGGIRDLLTRMKPDSIRDIIAANALYRPGPLGGGMLDAYIKRKHGQEKPDYPHPLMEDILSESYGVMVYQEQVMRILNRLGGIELSSAYACIKAISKKKHEIIDQRRAEFVAGAQQRGVNADVAQEIFKLITHFGGYGFNKSHSTAYAQLAYQTAYLKAHYPAEFMAAVLTSEIGNTDKIVEHFDNARQRGLEVLPPDVNRGEADFTVQDGRIVYGLAGIRGFGRKACDHLVQKRQEGGPFKDLIDFCERVDQKVVPRAAMEALIKSGAFDALGPNRRSLMEALAGALQAGTDLQSDRRTGQPHFDFFDADSAADTAQQTLIDLPEWPDPEKLRHEKEALGFYISSHPLARHAETLRQFSTHTVSQLVELAQAGSVAEVVIGGMVTGVRYTNAKRSRSGNTRMARFHLEDLTGAAECVIFPDDFLRHKDQVRDENICFVKGVVDRTREKPGLLVNRILTLEQAQRELTRGLLLRLGIGRHREEDLPAIGRMLQKTPGRCPVYLDITDAAGKHALLRLGENYAIEPSRLAASDLESLLGPGNVKFVGQANGNGRN